MRKKEIIQIHTIFIANNYKSSLSNLKIHLWYNYLLPFEICQLEEFSSRSVSRAPSRYTWRFSDGRERVDKFLMRLAHTSDDPFIHRFIYRFAGVSSFPSLFLFYFFPSIFFLVTETNGRRQRRNEAGSEFLADTRTRSTRWNIGLRAKSYGKVIIVRFVKELQRDFCKSIPLSCMNTRGQDLGEIREKYEERNENYYC